MALQLSYEDGNLAVVRASDTITRTETDEIKRQIVRFIRRYGRIQVLIIIEENFANLDMLASWDDDQDDEFIQQHVNRLAILGDIKFRDRAVLFFLKGFLPFSIEFFKSGHEEFARAWLTHP